MKWTKLTIDTTCEAEDLISAFLEEEGVLGVQIEDNIPLTEEEMETMFVDLLPDDMPENDGTAKVSCFLDDTFDVQEIKDKVAAEIRRLSEFLPVGTGEITESETKEEDWRDNWKAYFKPFRLYDNIIIKPTWEEVPEDATDEDIVIEIDPGTAFGTGCLGFCCAGNPAVPTGIRVGNDRQHQTWRPPTFPAKMQAIRYARWSRKPTPYQRCARALPEETGAHRAWWYRI